MALTMAATLLSFTAALFIERAAHLHADVLVLAVVLSLSLARAQRHADTRQRLSALVLIPVVAAGATLLGRLMSVHLAYGSAVFTVLMAVPIWIRRYGPYATRIGTLATLPLVALLVLPRPALPPRAEGALAGWAWSVLVGLLAAVSVWSVQGAADRFGMGGPEGVAAAPRRRRSSRLRPRPSTRMAVQMALAVGAGFVVGKAVFGTHWPWVVFTAILVGSGNRGRRDVLRKGLERLAGACGGTVLTAVGATPSGVGGTPCVVLIFLVLAVALWLRPRGYAYWAAGATAALALLYGYFGQDAQDLLPTRLGAIVVGAALAVAAAWWVLPVRGRGSRAAGDGTPPAAPAAPVTRSA